MKKIQAIRAPKKGSTKAATKQPKSPVSTSQGTFGAKMRAVQKNAKSKAGKVTF